MHSFATQSQFISCLRSTLTNYDDNNNDDNDDNDPLSAFFNQYESVFEYNKAAPSYDEFRRLCKSLGWPTYKQQRNHLERKGAWQKFRVAMVEAFNSTFGYDEYDSQNWERLCLLFGVDPVPESLQARKEVRTPSPFF